MNTEEEDPEFGKPKWRIPEWFSDLKSDELEKLQLYFDELMKFNSKINLISQSTFRKADLIHFSDSILGGKIVLNDSNSKEVFDFGSGNGFPGLVMAILEPGRKFYLVDSDTRKVEFLKHVIHTIGIKNCAPFHKRMDDLPENKIVCAVSRGLTNIPKALLMARKLFPKGGKLYHFKGSEWALEAGNIPHQVCLHWLTEHVQDYVLPYDKIRLSIIRSVKN
jgi:16S rRNA (guanine527-N7)-methyltransferase